MHNNERIFPSLLADTGSNTPRILAGAITLRAYYNRFLPTREVAILEAGTIPIAILIS